MDEAFHAGLYFNKSSEVGQVGDGAFRRLSGVQRSATVFHGSSRVWRIERETRLFSVSMPMTLTFTWSPLATMSLALALRCHASSLMWTSPSMAPRLTKTPKEVMLLTSPSRTSPSWTCS